jgi:hypothetical protein
MSSLSLSSDKLSLTNSKTTVMLSFRRRLNILWPASQSPVNPLTAVHFQGSLNMEIFLIVFNTEGFLFRVRQKVMLESEGGENSSLMAFPLNSSLTGTARRTALPPNQCSGSMTFWCGSGGSGSADPCL